ncbi:MAG: hypothetical protein ACR2PM_16600 [Hyphomicrobiales bacterium]
MNRYGKHLKDFDKAIGTITAARDGMQQEYNLLKQQFRTYLDEHETFTRNVRKYLDDLEADDDENTKRSPDAANSNQTGHNERVTRHPGE